MRRTGVGLAIIAAVLVGSTAAYGQDKKVQVNVGGGFTATVGQVHDHLGNGGNFMIGVTFNVNPHVGIQAEYGYTPVGSKTLDIPVIAPVGTTDPISAGHHMHQYTFNALLHFGDLNAKARPYAIVGGGVYNRVVQLTSPGTGLITVCDPWWFVCYPVAVPVTNVLGERTSTDFGMNYGVGVDIRLAGHVDAYVEARFHYIWGPTLSSLSSGGTLPPGVSDQNANGKYFPITFGLRF